MARLCVITDYLGDSTSLEEATLAEQGIDMFVAPSTDPSTWSEAARGADAILTRRAPIVRATTESLVSVVSSLATRPASTTSTPSLQTHRVSDVIRVLNGQQASNPVGVTLDRELRGIYR